MTAPEAGTSPRLDTLYVHVPFCSRRCDYCNFFRLVGEDADVRAAYLERLHAEAAAQAWRCGPLRSVYVGGGTPSHLTAPELERFLHAIRDHFALQPDAECSVECNPGSLDETKLRLLRDAGINRVSLGVQSFSMAERQTIGRHGDVAAIYRAVDLVRTGGIPQLSCDLIYGAPGQSLVDWERNVAELCRLEPDHVSAYELMIEPGTPLAHRRPQPLDDELLIAMWELAGERFGAAGLPRHEVSNYASPGAECRHNDDIWHGRPFLGLGPSACWFDGQTRWRNPANLRAWLADEPAEEDHLDPEARAVEILAVGLRTVAGWDLAAYRQLTSHDAMDLRGRTIAALITDDLLILAGNSLHPSNRGLLLHNHVYRELL